VQAVPALAVEAADGAQQTEPESAGGGSTKKEKEKLRKERQRQRKTEEAWEALQGAIEQMEETAGSVKAVEVAMQAALKHEARSERLAALVAEARELIEQARAAEAERARVAAEEAAAAAAVEAVAEAERTRVAAEAAEAERTRVAAEEAERVRVAAEAAEAAAAVEAAAKAEAAAERLRLEEEVAALTLGMQRDALRLQQAQAQLGVPPAAPAPHPDDAEEDQCVMCFDAPKDHIILPCYHVCVCEACANLLTQMRKPSCPICRTAIQHTNKVFHS
jgi:hypothetical protein